MEAGRGEENARDHSVQRHEPYWGLFMNTARGGDLYHGRQTFFQGRRSPPSLQPAITPSSPAPHLKRGLFLPLERPALASQLLTRRVSFLSQKSPSLRFMRFGEALTRAFEPLCAARLDCATDGNRRQSCL
jgi:hypothetical protein